MKHSLPRAQRLQEAVDGSAGGGVPKRVRNRTFIAKRDESMACAKDTGCTRFDVATIPPFSALNISSNDLRTVTWQEGWGERVPPFLLLAAHLYSSAPTHQPPSSTLPHPSRKWFQLLVCEDFLFILPEERNDFQFHTNFSDRFLLQKHSKHAGISLIHPFPPPR